MRNDNWAQMPQESSKPCSLQVPLFGKNKLLFQTDLFSGQIILRTPSIALRSIADARRKAEPKIQQFLTLRGHGTASTEDPFAQASGGTASASAAHQEIYDDRSSADDLDLVHLQADIDAQRAELERIDKAGYQIVADLGSALVTVEQKVKQMDKDIESIRRDTNGQGNGLRSLKSEVSELEKETKNDWVVSRLDQELVKTNDLVAQLQKDLLGVGRAVRPLDDSVPLLKRDLHLLRQENEQLKAELKDTTQVAREGLHTAKEYASETTSLRHEVMQLRTELGRERAKKMGASSSTYSGELEILTSRLSKVGNQAGQIESLQMEFDLFKRRLQRLETRQESEDSMTESHRPMDREFISQPDAVPQQRFGGGHRQKRTTTGRGSDDIFSTTPPKRQAMNSEYASAATRSYGSARRWEPSSPPGPAFEPDTEDSRPRLTKSGNIVKNTPKRPVGRPRRSTGPMGEERGND